MGTGWNRGGPLADHRQEWPHMSTLRERAGGYLREAPGGVNLEKFAVYAALAFALYSVYKVYRGTKAVTDALHNAGSAAGSAIFDWFHPDQVGETIFYTVQFPDGSKHAIASRAVGSDGGFLFNNVRYRIRVDKSIVSGINKFAVRV
jgi:hypothetical protein